MASMACPAHPPPWNSAYRPSKTFCREIWAWVAGRCNGQCYQERKLCLVATEKLTSIALEVLSSDAQTLAMILRFSEHSIAKLATVFNACFLLEHGMWRSGVA
eukprot:544895-Pelagomonas_calceolata.AAC.12